MTTRRNAWPHGPAEITRLAGDCARRGLRVRRTGAGNLAIGRGRSRLIVPRTPGGPLWERNVRRLVERHHPAGGRWAVGPGPEDPGVTITMRTRAGAADEDRLAVVWDRLRTGAGLVGAACALAGDGRLLVRAHVHAGGPDRAAAVAAALLATALAPAPSPEPSRAARPGGTTRDR
jgi:hypothetical protein